MHLRLNKKFINFPNFDYLEDAKEIVYVPGDRTPLPEFFCRIYDIPQSGFNVRTYGNLHLPDPKFIDDLFNFAQKLTTLEILKSNILLFKVFGNMPPHIDQPAYKSALIFVLDSNGSILSSTDAEDIRLINGDIVALEICTKHSLKSNNNVNYILQIPFSNNYLELINSLTILK